MEEMRFKFGDNWSDYVKRHFSQEKWKFLKRIY